jgi:hypothetical protein
MFLFEFLLSFNQNLSIFSFKSRHTVIVRGVVVLKDARISLLAMGLYTPTSNKYIILIIHYICYCN